MSCSDLLKTTRPTQGTSAGFQSKKCEEKGALGQGKELSVLPVKTQAPSPAPLPRLNQICSLRLSFQSPHCFLLIFSTPMPGEPQDPVLEPLDHLPSILGHSHPRLVTSNVPYMPMPLMFSQHHLGVSCVVVKQNV